MLLSAVLLLAMSVVDDPRFVEAGQKIAAFDYEGALTLLDTLGAEVTTPEDRVVVLLSAGKARALLGDDGAARSAFEAALLLDRSAALSNDTSPKVRALFDDVRLHLPPPTPAAPAAPAATEAPAQVEAPATVAAVEPVPAAAEGVHWLVPAVGAGVGLTGLVVGGIAGYDTWSRAGVASAPSTSQVDAVSNINAANTSLIVASVAGGAGVLLIAVAGLSLLW